MSGAPVGELQARFGRAEELLRVIRSGEVDALVVSGPLGDQVYTLTGADHPYRVMVEAMSEGAAILTADGTIRLLESQLCGHADAPLEELFPVRRWIVSCFRRLASFQHVDLRDRRRHQEGGNQADSKGGSVVPVLAARSSSFDSGTPRSACAIVTDLTEHKRHQGVDLFGSLSGTDEARRGRSGSAPYRGHPRGHDDSFFLLDREWHPQLRKPRSPGRS